MTTMRALPPMHIVPHADDHDRYGAGPWLYDEAALSRLPVREIIAIEAEIGMSLPTMMLRLRSDYADAKLGAAWIARRQAGETDRFDDFAPLVTLLRMETAPATDPGPPDQGSSSSPSTDPPSE